MPQATTARIVLTTAASDAQARPIANALVAERLAACVNISAPVYSVYRWRGRVERGREVILLIKTRAALIAKLERRLHELHPYAIPEFLVVNVARGSSAYLNWIADATVSRPVRAVRKR